LGNGEWDIPKLRSLLGKPLPEHGATEAGEIEAYEVEHDFPDIGQRTMLLNARFLDGRNRNDPLVSILRKVFYEAGSRTNILLGIEDVTEKRVLEREKDELLRQKDVLMDELRHRVANSLQIIASIIMMKARTVKSEETRRHLQPKTGLGIVKALAKQLDAKIVTLSGPHGTTVSVTHSTFAAKEIRAA
jgi:chemotaxis protein methyltransferase CheR